MSLYLKYRPKDFENLMGQSFVKETLQKAIAWDKTVWAYLFCGPRGTWKTTTARLLAKTINCENTKDWNPCLECDICKDFLEEKLVDIIEIDAASHTWVDNIRDLIEKAQFTPTRTKYKIYIIDEVHMLSKWAFNALLKILEEPPKHVKFILATTETHQVPETIISRCQRYDFKRISDSDIEARLEFIAKNENIEVDKKAISYIINNSSGWLRNAISLFEQFIIDNRVNYDDIVTKLEIVSDDLIKDFLDKLLNKDSSIIDIFDKLIADWKNIKLFFKELLFYTKNESLEKLKKSENISDYISILEILDETYTKTKHSLDENTTFLIWVLKILTPPQYENKITPPPSGTPLEKGRNNKVQENIIKEKKDELNHDDLNDIFWEEETQTVTPPPSGTPLEKGRNYNSPQNNNSINNGFDLNTFIDKLKQNWAKWWLTMAVRWSSISLWDNDIIIWAKTKIARSQFENVDNQSIILKSLKDMWSEKESISIR